jgi:adenylylsulfate kinase
VVAVALISPFREDRAGVAARVREYGIPFAEVLVNAPLSACELRDPKGLYRKARAGEIPQFTGIDSPYEPPLAPALELRTDLEAVGDSVAKLMRLALEVAGRNAEPV